MLTLYPDQQDLENEIKAKWEEGKKRLIVRAPTGFGKTVLFAHMVMLAVKKGSNVLIVSHREEVLNQTNGTLSKFGLKAELITRDTKKVPTDNLYVAMIETLVNRLKLPGWIEWYDKIPLLILDEAHEQLFNKLLDVKQSKSKYILGFTATPLRKGKQRQLSDDYEDMVCSPDVQELINTNRLVTDKYFSVPVDMKGVKTSMGEYNTEQMFEKYDKSELYAGVIDNWLNICPNTVTLVFCCNIQHSLNTCKSFNERGIKAKFIVSDVAKPEPLGLNPTDGEIAKFNIKNAEYQNYLTTFSAFSGKRSDIIEEWKNGEFFVLINSGIATTGFDHPPIQTVILNRATTSVNLLYQMIGRGSRTFKDKSFFNILDFGDNCNRLNAYYRLSQDYSLTHEVSKSGEGVGGVKDCPKCGALLPMSMMTCKYCGHIWEKTHEQVIVDLVEVNYGEAISTLKTIKDYELFAEAKKYNKNWLFRQIYMKFGRDGLVEYQKTHHLQPSWVFIKIARYNAAGIKSNK